MKTSLNLEDSLYRAAQAEARRSGKSVSQTISEWARAGREFLLRDREKRKKPTLTAAENCGELILDVSSRKHWMEVLDRIEDKD